MLFVEIWNSGSYGNVFLDWFRVKGQNDVQNQRDYVWLHNAKCHVLCKIS